MKKICQNCKYWKTRGTQDPLEWGTCSELNFTLDIEGYTEDTELFCPKDFGCNMFGPKEIETKTEPKWFSQKGWNED